MKIPRQKLYKNNQIKTLNKYQMKIKKIVTLICRKYLKKKMNKTKKVKKKTKKKLKKLNQQKEHMPLQRQMKKKD